MSVFFAKMVKAKAQQTFTMTSIFVASPCGDRKTVQALSANACTTPPDEHIVYSRFRSHPRRRFLQVHQLGDNDGIPAESLEGNGRHGCEEDIEQQRRKHASVP